MAKNEKFALTSGEDDVRSVDMHMEDDNYECDLGDHGCDDCDSHLSDADSEPLERDKDMRSIRSEEFHKDLDDTLSSMVSRLCSICVNFFKEEIKISPKYYGDNLTGSGAKVYHSSTFSLMESVNRHCPLCQDLFKELYQVSRIDPRLQRIWDNSPSIWCLPEHSVWDDDTKGSEEGAEAQGLGLRFHLCDQNGQVLSARPHIFLGFFHYDSLGIGPDTVFRDLSLNKTSANSARSIGLARSWYKECLDHRSCRPWYKTSIAPPTRLVRVQKLDYGPSPRISANVCETKNLSPGAVCRYTTLSHRWGDEPILKLQQDNIDTFRQAIPIDQLPVLFKDAMQMTCQLGLEYIWIDCLCILQGSKDDWKLEAEKMGDYYRYAQLNLSASGYAYPDAGYEDSSMGLFRERPALSFINYPIRTKFVSISRVDGQEVDAHYEGIYIRVEEYDFYRYIIQSPLGCRGWVAQERALSPRILHFTPRQMWWECTEHIFNETFPTVTLPWRDARWLGPGAMRILNTASSSTPPWHIYLSWDQFVQHYASTQLTFDTDRFPAVIGIARIYGAILRDNFIAGLWEGQLIRLLAWKAVKKAWRIPSVQVAPSWSWASLSLEHTTPVTGSAIRGISFRVLSETPNFECDLQTTTFEKSGVQGLEMTGPLRRLSVQLDDLPHWRDFATKMNTNHDVENASMFSEKDILGQEWRWEDHTHILPLWEWNACTPKTAVRVEGLLLQQVPLAAAGPRDTFRRLGSFNLVFPSHELCKKYLGLMEENGSYKPSVDFEECGLQEFDLV